MKIFAAFASLLAAAPAFADSFVLDCSRILNERASLLHGFEFRQLPQEIWPPRFEIRVTILETARTPGTPHDPVASDDPAAQGQRVLVDQTFPATRDASDSQLFHFAPTGFLRFDAADGGYIVTWQMPGELLPRSESGCRMPEPGLTVHN